LFAPSPVCFAGQGKIECLKPEYHELRSEFKPVSAHSMCIQLLLRPLSQDEKLFKEDQPRFETLLGCFDSKEGKRRAVTIILMHTGPAKYRRLVHDKIVKPRRGIRRLLESQDLRVADFDENSHTSTAWSIRDIFINNPRLSLPFTPTEFWINSSYLRMSLNCTSALRAGLEVGGFWGVEDVKVEHLSGEKIYTATVYDPSSLTSRPYSMFAFTVRNVNSGEICGLITSFEYWVWLGVSIVRDLDEKDFKQGTFFDRAVNRKYAQDSRIDALAGWKLHDGSHLFFNLEVQGNNTAHLKVGIIQ
jgi:hypothetical protein